MLTGNDIDIIEQTVIEQEVKEVRVRNLVLYNDDVNTFDFVIDSLMEICNHDLIQAEQCTLIVHNNGKCSVKRDSYTRLKPMREGLCDRGLSAVIE